jgi:hypothetical protein
MLISFNQWELQKHKFPEGSSLSKKIPKIELKGSYNVYTMDFVTAFMECMNRTYSPREGNVFSKYSTR